MILVPVAQPYAFYSGIIAELGKPFPIGSRIDQQTSPFHIYRMAKGIPAAILPGDEPYWPEVLFFYGISF
jgi:hypothetical protein